MTIRRHITILAATTALTLAAASPANAIYRSYEPGDADEPTIERTAEADDTGTGQKGCTVDIKAPDGSTQSSITYPHGYSFKAVNKATGKTHTYTCENGTWKETVSAVSPTSGNSWEADSLFVEDSGTLAGVNLRERYSYSSSDEMYATP